MGEFPKEERISARVSGKTKRQLSKLPYSYGEVLEIGANYLSSEINMLEYQKGELELEISNLEKQTKEKENHLHAINNRIRLINPRRLDKETLDTMISEAALDYAREIYDAHGDNSLNRLQSRKAISSVYKTAKDWKFDEFEFMKEVKNHLKKLCHT